MSNHQPGYGQNDANDNDQFEQGYPYPGAAHYGEQPTYGQGEQYGTSASDGQSQEGYSYSPQAQYVQPSYAPQGPSPYGQSPYGQYAQYPSSAAPQYATFGARAGGYLLDGIFAFLVLLVLAIPGAVIAEATSTTEYDSATQQDTSVPGMVGVVLIGLGFLAQILFNLWNRGYRLGKTGQSLGGSIVNIQVVKRITRQPPGIGKGIGRELLFQVFGFLAVIPLAFVLTLLNLLLPAWDHQKQTLVDKLVETHVVEKPRV